MQRVLSRWQSKLVQPDLLAPMFLVPATVGVVVLSRQSKLVQPNLTAPRFLVPAAVVGVVVLSKI